MSDHSKDLLYFSNRSTVKYTYLFGSMLVIDSLPRPEDIELAEVASPSDRDIHFGQQFLPPKLQQ